MKMTRGIILIFAVFMGSLFGASSCEENTPTPESVVKTLLTANTWVPGSVAHETDGDLTSQYTGFEITFSGGEANSDTGGTYTVVNGGNAFPSNSGSWSFVPNSNFSKIERADGVVMDLVVTDSTLKLEFTIESSSARMSGASGVFAFDLVAK